MATHSSVLAWRILGTEEAGGLHTVPGVTKRQTQMSDLAAAYTHTHTHTQTHTHIKRCMKR